MTSLNSRHIIAPAALAISHDVLSEITTPHIASPDAHVDAERSRFVIYFDGLDGVGHRHYGLLASSARKATIARARELLAVASPPEPVEVLEPLDWLPPCPSVADA